MGEVVAIYIGPERQLPQPVERVEAHAGKGLAGNRYYWRTARPPRGMPRRSIAEEALDAFRVRERNRAQRAGEQAERSHARAST